MNQKIRNFVKKSSWHHDLETLTFEINNNIYILIVNVLLYIILYLNWIQLRNE